MPSSYLRFAQDFDGDGRRDIWSSQPDVFASIAYYLQQHGWTAGQAWGREVRIPVAARPGVKAIPLRESGCRAERLMSDPQPVSAWRKLGLTTLAGTPLPASDIQASLVQNGSRAFLLYGNYQTLLDYNCAHTYALSVALLADRLAELPTSNSQSPNSSTSKASTTKKPTTKKPTPKAPTAEKAAPKRAAPKNAPFGSW
jgi:membrane-bound lytic murein transglycosylase B